MVFSSTTFLFLFLPALLLLYFCRKGMGWRNGVLLVFSLIFYSFGEPVWVLGMIGVTLINYFVALKIHRTRRKRPRKLLLALGVVSSLILLVFFKYSSFLLNTVYGVFRVARTAPERHLPIGISFYTFQVLTYTVDVYRKKARPQTSPFRTLLYISCFPQLIAGPIVQYADVAEALGSRRTSPTDFYRGLQRFMLGLGRRCCWPTSAAKCWRPRPWPGPACGYPCWAAGCRRPSTPCSSISTSPPTPTWPSA